MRASGGASREVDEESSGDGADVYITVRIAAE